MPSSIAAWRSRIGASVAIAGALAFVALESVAESRYPRFDRMRDPISLLGNSEATTRGLWMAALLVLVVAWFVGVIGLMDDDRPRPLLLGINALPVVGIAGAALIPLDRNLAVHEIFAFAAFLGGSLAVVADAGLLRLPWRGLSIALASISLFGLSPASGPLIRAVGWGAVERMVAFPLVGAVAVFGVAALVGGRRPGPTSARRSVDRVTAGLLVAALVTGIAGIGSGLTAGGYEKVVAWLGTLIPGAG